MTTPVGRLRRRWSLRERVEDRDSRGERVHQWSEVGKVRGEAPREANTTSRGEGGAVTIADRFRLRTRYTSVLKTGMQIVNVNNEEEFYFVDSATDIDGRRRFLQLVLTRFPPETS